jgi:hypothetical protein
MNLYYEKYLKYKKKYNLLKNQFGGVKYLINGQEMEGDALEQRLSDGFTYYEANGYNNIDDFWEARENGDYEDEIEELTFFKVYNNLDEFDPQVNYLEKAPEDHNVDEHFGGVINNEIYLFESENQFRAKLDRYNHLKNKRDESERILQERQNALNRPFATQFLHDLAQERFDIANLTHLLNINKLEITIKRIKLISINNKMNIAESVFDFNELTNLSREINQTNAELSRLLIDRADLRRQLDVE